MTIDFVKESAVFAFAWIHLSLGAKWFFLKVVLDSIFSLSTVAGCIGIVDYDTVEISNLHRQVLHTEGRVNISKAESIKIQLNQ